MTTPPLYSPLDPSIWQIRIIRLLPGSPDAMVECELKLHTLTTHPKYIALSYCWGDEMDRNVINVNGSEISVTANLEKALQQLRALNVEFVWVDALCINQSDVQERSLQVRLMKMVYTQADATYSWIGDNLSDNAAQALKTLQQISLQPNTLIEATKKSTRKKWKRSSQGETQLEGLLASAMEMSEELDNHDLINLESFYAALLDLLTRPYWQRRWIIQEAAVADSTQILCGDIILGLDDLNSALKLCKENKDWWTALHEHSYRFLVQIASFRSACYSRELPRLLVAMLNTRDCLSKDKRDQVFALLGICADGNDLVPIPSYDGTSETVSVLLTRELLKQGKAFEIILAGGQNRFTNKSLPTWCPDWLGGRLEPEVYQAAARIKYLNQEYGRNGVLDDMKKLHVQGVEFGTVVAMTSVLTSSPLDETSQTIQQPKTHPAQNIRLHGRAIRAAVSTCLRGSPQIQQAYTSFCPSPIPYSLELKLLMAMSRDSKHVRMPDFNGPRWPTLHSWIAANKDFVIGGQTLEDLCMHRSSFIWAIFIRLLLAGARRSWTFISIFGMVIIAVLAFLAVAVARSGSLALIMFVVAIIALIFVFICGMLLFSSPVNRAYNRLNSVAKSLSSARLVVLHTGDIALACSEVEIGDKICLLVGCKSAAVLREEPQTSPDQLHSVIGYSFVALRKKDEERYAGFHDPRPIMHRAMVKEMKRRHVGSRHDIPEDELKGRYYRLYDDIINKCKQYENWRNYTLI